MSIQYKSWILIIDTGSQYYVWNWMMTTRWWHCSSRYSIFLCLYDSGHTSTTGICRQIMLQTLTAIRTGWSIFGKYYSFTDKVTVYAAALLLAHHRRKAYMARNWKRESIPKATENVRMLWSKKYKDKASSVHLSTESTKEPDEFDLWERDQSTISQVGNEFDSFIDSNPVLLDERETSLSLWLGRSSTTHLS
jgi:hypothetical protein